MVFKRSRFSIWRIRRAIARRDLRLARRLLRAWWLPLKTEDLPRGPVWVVGGYYSFEFQRPLLDRLSNLPATPEAPRVIVGRRSFWELAAEELWLAGEFDELERRLPGTLVAYGPTKYVVYGRLLARRNRRHLAGKYLLLSGRYSSGERELVDGFKASLRGMHPNQVVSQFPRPCRRRAARARFPDRVLKDLESIPCPPWWTP